MQFLNQRGRFSLTDKLELVRLQAFQRILSLRIPFDLSVQNGNRIFVTAMTETVIEKLKNNTKRLFLKFEYII